MSISYLIKAIDIDNYSQALSILCTEGLFYSVNSQNILSIKARLFNGKQDNYPTPLRLLLIALILITKTTLEIKEQKQISQYLSDTLNDSSYKQLSAGLLVRLPNFQNYHTVVAHLHPDSIPLNIMSEIAPKIREKKSAALEKQIMKYRQDWVILLNGYDFNLDNLNSIMEEYRQLKNETNQYELLKKLQSQISFLKLRIRNMNHQKIDLNKFAATIEQIMKVQPMQEISLQNQQFSPLSELFSSSGYSLLNQMIAKIKTGFILKFQWLLQIVNHGVKNLANSPKLTLEILKLINTVLKVFGNGAIDLEKILFQSVGNLLQLLQNLLTESQNKLFNMQQPVNIQKFKQQTKLTIEKKEDPYVDFVKPINKNQRIQIITAVFQILISYLKQPHENKYIAQLNLVLDSNSHKLSTQINQLFLNIKNLMFPRAIVYSPGLQQVYEQIILQNALKKKRKVDESPVVYPVPSNPTRNDSMRLIQSKIQPAKSSLLMSEYISYGDNDLLQRSQIVIENSIPQNNSIFKNAPKIKDSFMSYGNIQNSNYSIDEFQSYSPALMNQSKDSFKSYGNIQMSKDSIFLQNSIIRQQPEISKDNGKKDTEKEQNDHDLAEF